MHIIENADELVAAAMAELSLTDRENWLTKVDEYLSTISWDATWERMDELMQNKINTNQNFLTNKINQHV